jgi:hypothetical protein
MNQGLSPCPAPSPDVWTVGDLGAEGISRDPVPIRQSFQAEVGTSRDGDGWGITRLCSKQDHAAAFPADLQEPPDWDRHP